MNSKFKTTGVALAAAAAVAFTAVPMTSAMAAHHNHDKVKCVGVNSCKGKSKCKTNGGSCKGKNGCKGKGFVMLKKDKCISKLSSQLKDCRSKLDAHKGNGKNGDEENGDEENS